MTVKELAAKLNLTYLCNEDVADVKEINGCYCGDLLSWVMGRAQADNAWITIMSNINIALDPNQIKNFIEWKKSLYSKVLDKTVAESKINTSQSEGTELEDQQGDQGGSSDNNTPPTPQPQGDDDPKIKRKEFGERKKLTSSHVYVSGKYFYKWLHSNDNIAIKTFGNDIQSLGNALCNASRNFISSSVQ